MSVKHSINHLGITLLRAADPRVRRIRRQQSRACAHGNKVWRSSLVMMDYLVDNPPLANSCALDLGCGWGALAVHLAVNFDAQVTALDIDPRVEPLVKLHANINDCDVNFVVGDLATIGTAELATYTVIVGADICFWDEIIEPLFELIIHARELNRPTILIADPGRPPFWTLADRCVAELGAEVISRTIYDPWRTQKFILRIADE